MTRKSKKSFFKERTVAGIKNLHSSNAYSQRHLVNKINDLDPLEEGLILYTQLVPGKFHRKKNTQSQASRKCYHHGDLIHLSHPETKKDCYNSPKIPLQLRQEAFSELEKTPENKIFATGFSFKPGWGDRMERVVPFVWNPEAMKLFVYSENMTKGIKINFDKYGKRAKKEGASFVLEVPSRTAKHPRYSFGLSHVPIKRNQHNLSTILSLRPTILQNPETREPESERIAHDKFNIRYTWENERERSNIITFYPHDIAGYIGIIKQEYKKHNLTPLEMNPFSLFSRKGTEFYKKLCNNTLVLDPTIKRKDKLRKPHIVEKSILLARAIGKFGHDEIAYWDPERDGKIKDYNWSIK